MRRQKTAEMRAVWHKDVANWLKAWTQPASDQGMTAGRAYESWSHWDDHQRQHLRGRDRGCLAGDAVRADVHGAYPSSREFGIILGELGVARRRTGSGIVYGIVPTNDRCPLYPNAPKRRKGLPR